ncbi:unnamed protein product [Rotaria sordida]|uniref:G-protein coupled receptors family 1 profile domain-containing protein n=1 Tax=Rotaria sordida TaxID=392033 RepID=A0A813PSB9_9BILA|nr:unnamed protein product [Rotaria sordida]CAF3598818.1 unnamed protein product [Rotaria sordida]CAF3639105.1 unnamed protein product [Rotaria sordida]
MDCFLTYNLSCVNGTFAQFNTSSVIFGDIIDPSVITGGDSSNNDLTSSTDHPISSSILVSVQHCILTAIILGAIILATITGNILVIVAVKIEKSLHSVAYYLFVSLAVADLMVASMVMPIAVLKEVTRSWVLGSFVCDAWVMIDLLCCTASILHLVAIALDRYWAITNLDYATKRTSARILILICVIWSTSILISSSHLFPIFRDKRGRPPGQCHLIGNVPYTIISTIGAFYIPLIVMCIIYWKIFQAAKFRIRRKAFNSNRSMPLPSTTGTTVTTTLIPNPHDVLLSSEIPISNHEISLTDKTKYQSFSPLLSKKYSKKTSHLSNHHPFDTEQDRSSQYPLSTNQSNNDYHLKKLKKTSSSASSYIKKKHDSIITTTTKATTPIIQLSTTNRIKQEYDELHRVNSSPSCSSTRRLTASSSSKKDSPIIANKINNPLVISNSYPLDSTHIIDTPTIKSITKNRSTNTNNINPHNNNNINNTPPITKSPGTSSRKKIDIKRERKATKVLGVVMGCFILCWLPFFIEETICGLFHLTINEKIISVLTWLGYLNSLLNPVIYTIFSPDFRQAFGKILFGKYQKRRRTKK